MVSPYVFETPSGDEFVIISYGDHDLQMSKPIVSGHKSRYSRTPNYLNPNRHKRPQRRSKARRTRSKSRMLYSSHLERRRASRRPFKKTRGYHSPGRGPPGRSSPTRTKSKSRYRRYRSRSKRKGYFWSRKHRRWIRSKFSYR